LEIELKNIILRRVSIFEFLHSQGQKRKWRRFQVRSALPHKAEINARDCDVRFVPTSDVTGNMHLISALAKPLELLT
jgi:hypothetical protein